MVADTGSHLQVFVITLTGNTITLEVSPGDTISRIKELVDQRRGVPADQQRLCYSGRELDNERTISDYNVTRDSTLHLTVRLRGGFVQPVRHADMQHAQTGSFSVEAPDWRAVSKGFNVEGICINSECDAQGQGVIIKKKFGTFHMSEVAAKAKCPQCSTLLVDVINSIFTGCVYSVEGAYHNARGERVEIKSEETTVPKNKYVHFRNKYGHVELVNWLFIKIVVKTHPSDVPKKKKKSICVVM